VSRQNENYQFIPGWKSLNWEQLKNTDDTCFLVALDGQMLSILLSLVDMVLPWYWLWQIDKQDNTSKSELRNFIARLEFCLMAGCEVENLIKTNLMILSALSGQEIDLDADLPTGNYTAASAVSGAIGTQTDTQHTDAGDLRTRLEADTTSIVNSLAEIRDAMTAINQTITENGGVGDLTEQIDQVEELLNGIGTILGAAALLV